MLTLKILILLSIFLNLLKKEYSAFTIIKQLPFTQNGNFKGCLFVILEMKIQYIQEI